MTDKGWVIFYHLLLKPFKTLKPPNSNHFVHISYCLKADIIHRLTVQLQRTMAMSNFYLAYIPDFNSFFLRTRMMIHEHVQCCGVAFLIWRIFCRMHKCFIHLFAFYILNNYSKWDYPFSCLKSFIIMISVSNVQQQRLECLFSSKC